VGGRDDDHEKCVAYAEWIDSMLDDEDDVELEFSMLKCQDDQGRHVLRLSEEGIETSWRWIVTESGRNVHRTRPQNQGEMIVPDRREKWSCPTAESGRNYRA
jgi:hypothetical protein